METLRNLWGRRLRPCDVLGEDNRFTNSFDFHSLQLTKSLDIFGRDNYRMLFLTNADNIDEYYTNNTGNVFMVKTLFEGGLVVLVRDRKLQFCDFKTGTMIEERSYPDKIVDVKINRARLVVFLQSQIYIYDIKTMKNIHNITLRIPHLPEGLCDMTMDSNNCLVAFPAKKLDGATIVQLFDALNLTKKIELCPYTQTPLRAMTFNTTGTQLVTTSCEGTTIDVYSTSDGTKLFGFYRGVLHRDISCLTVSDCGEYVACSSKSRTIHVFKQEEKPVESSIFGYLTYYLPDIIERQLDGPRRAHAYIHLPVGDVQSVVSLLKYKTKHMVVVTTSDGAVYVYPLDAKKGGKLRLQKGWNLDFDEENALAPSELHRDGINLLREENAGRPVALEKLYKLKLEE